MLLPKLNLHTILFVAAIVLVTLKFRNQISAIVVKIPVIGPLAVG